MNDKVQYWLETAQYDLETAQAMLDTGRYLYVGFTCHLTTEKALKAVITSSGQFPPKIHNLPKLADIGGITDKLSDEQIQFIVDVNPLNIAGRYPTYKDKIDTMLTKERCMDLIKRTEAFYLWIKEYLK